MSQQSMLYSFFLKSPKLDNANKAPVRASSERGGTLPLSPAGVRPGAAQKEGPGQAWTPALAVSGTGEGDSPLRLGGVRPSPGL